MSPNSIQKIARSALSCHGRFVAVPDSRLRNHGPPEAVHHTFTVKWAEYVLVCPSLKHPNYVPNEQHSKEERTEKVHEVR